MNNKKFNLLTTLNLNCNDQRWNEFRFCLHKNSQNKLIDSIYIAIEMDDNNQEHLSRYKEVGSLSEKIFVHTIKNRPTFKYLFSFCNNKPAKWIVSNGDIYFPESNTKKLELLSKKDYNKEFFVLTRYNILNEMKEKIRGINILYDGLKLRTMWLNGGSIDSWIFETPFDFSKINLDIGLGQPHCDQMMNYQLSKIRKVSNPCLSVISIHKHSGWYPWYNKLNSKGVRPGQQLKKAMEKKGHRCAFIKFSHLD